MPPAPAPDPAGPASLVLAGFVALAAAFLAWRQWRDYWARPDQLSPADENHYARQDLRRTLGTIVLLMLAAALGYGGRLPAKVNGAANVAFVRIWSGICVLIVVLLILAMLDWVSTRIYAHRHRQRLTQEGLSIVEAELRVKLALARAKREAEGLNGAARDGDA